MLKGKCSLSNKASVGFNMATSEKLCLQWNDFKENISSSFGDLRGDKDFTDVTLVCEDGQQVEVHKVVLASSSPFFKELLRKNSHPHPLVYMRALKSEDLIAMVDFLYFGEANIFQENLDSFLALAEELKLKGLNNTDNSVNDAEVKIPSVYQEIATKKEKLQPQRGQIFDPDNQTFSSSEMRVATISKNAVISADLEDLDKQIRSMITKSDVNHGTGKGKVATCNICGKEGPYKDMPRHVEANHITGVCHACNICGSISRSKHGLNQHMTRNHKAIIAGPDSI